MPPTEFEEEANDLILYPAAGVWEQVLLPAYQTLGTTGERNMREVITLKYGCLNECNKG